MYGLVLHGTRTYNCSATVGEGLRRKQTGGRRKQVAGEGR